MNTLTPSFLAFFAIVVLVVIVMIVIPRITEPDRRYLFSLWQAITTELTKAQHSNDPEKRTWGFQTVVLKADSFLGKVLSAKGCKDPSVKQKLRTAMQRKMIEYEDFQLLKEFHVLRNQLAHEERTIQAASEEHLILQSLAIVKKLLDTV